MSIFGECHYQSLAAYEKRFGNHGGALILGYGGVC